MKRNLLVLGASSELAAAALERVAGQYQTVFAHYCHSEKRLLELKKTLPCELRIVQADFTDEASTTRFVDVVKSSGLPVTDILHCPSARLETLRFKALQWERYETMLNTQLRSLFYAIHAFLPEMAKRKEGRVVAVLSSAVTGTPPSYMNHYITAKYALMGFLKALAAEYASKNIQINMVSPSMIETAFVGELSHLVIEKNAAENPQGRNATVEDIAPLLEYLLVGESGFITGQNFLIAGGSLI